jgi:hypothetical protein
MRQDYRLRPARAEKNARWAQYPLALKENDFYYSFLASFFQAEKSDLKYS